LRTPPALGGNMFAQESLGKKTAIEETVTQTDDFTEIPHGGAELSLPDECHAPLIERVVVARRRSNLLTKILNRSGVIAFCDIRQAAIEKRERLARRLKAIDRL
jgi:hypothetical protein